LTYAINEYQVQAYVDGVNLQAENINTKKKKTKELCTSSKCFDLEVNVEKTKYMFMFCQNTVGQNNNI